MVVYLCSFLTVRMLYRTRIATTTMAAIKPAKSGVLSDVACGSGCAGAAGAANTPAAVSAYEA